MSKKILLIDDNADIQKITRVFLESFDHKVVLVGSAEEAYEQLKSASFDIVITDVNLPGESGIDLVQKIRDKYRNLDFIIISGDQSFIQEWNLAEIQNLLKVKAVLEKPFRFEYLLELVDSDLVAR